MSGRAQKKRVSSNNNVADNNKKPKQQEAVEEDLSVAWKMTWIPRQTHYWPRSDDASSVIDLTAAMVRYGSKLNDPAFGDLLAKTLAVVLPGSHEKSAVVKILSHYKKLDIIKKLYEDKVIEIGELVSLSGDMMATYSYDAEIANYIISQIPLELIVSNKWFVDGVYELACADGNENFDERFNFFKTVVDACSLSSSSFTPEYKWMLWTSMILAIRLNRTELVKYIVPYVKGIPLSEPNSRNIYALNPKTKAMSLRMIEDLYQQQDEAMMLFYKGLVEEVFVVA